ncbi:flagellar motor protein MotB [Hydrogenibacillus schlegelii]|uniref:Flagellar motor rotation protein MotB n=1 Tax=Hydrogenibacillus schlegelii TaxID=1484 RepID=A0A2T5GC15_HYDSH|nr:flagellar motor protein MotB [Hydrogenibacillus schlegelii]PTQ53715.1 MAG: Flagellar motor rotation protein MotB [Hydrogenibacillus schlegelii]
MRRRKTESDEHLNETWLIPYADMLTLLLALFIVLFAMSEIDAARVAKLANAFNIAFSGGSGVLQFERPVPPEAELPNVPRARQDDRRLSPEEAAELARIREEKRQLQAIQQEMDRFIRENGLEPYLSTVLDETGLKLLIGEQALFPSGSATLTPEAEAIARRVSEILVHAYPREITVSGHTDNVPISTPEFPSNWELSAARAANFLQALLKNPQLDPKTFRLIGYGEYRPIADNRTPEGRAKNRRVEVSIEPLIPLKPPEQTPADAPQEAPAPPRSGDAGSPAPAGAPSP